MSRRPVTPARLQLLFANLIAGAAAASQVGCDGATGPTIDPTGFEPIACGANGDVDRLTDLVLPVPVDYLELRPVPEMGGPVGEVQMAGDACATATDVAACQAAIMAATSTQGFVLGDCVDFCPSYFLVVSSGDLVEVLSSSDAVKERVVPIDGPTDAVLAVELAGYTVLCGDPERGVKEVADGYEILAVRTTSICEPIESTLYRLHVKSGGAVEELESEVVSTSDGCVGRRPRGLLSARVRGGGAVGRHFAAIAHLEAASVVAFDVLGKELEAHGAPRALVRAAGRARRDEVRHAAVMARLARRFGVEPSPPRVSPNVARSLEEIATENAVEGCTREAFGALVGAWQARFSEDAAVRHAMRVIAADEARHASLSFAVDRWARPRLSAGARRRVDAARTAAALDLMNEPRREPAEGVVRLAGVPRARQARALATAFGSWALGSSPRG